MKKKILPFAILSLVAVGALISFVNTSKDNPDYVPTHAASLPTTITLKDNSESEIRNYYSSLNDLSTDERRGTELLKSLKSILKEDTVYYDYGSASSVGVNHIYTITDRDWVHSPASTTISGGTYNSSTNQITNFNHTTELKSNPYLKMLYVDYTKTEKTDSYTGSGVKYDKEHVWSQSHGFKASSGATGPAGTDLHNLIAGDSGVNRNYHNNYSYGIVDDNDPESKIAGPTTKNSYGWYITGNKYGVSTITNAEYEFEKVFEPLDADKGRIARAILYMVARYNNLSGTDTITNFDPNLELVDYIISGGSSEYSTANTTAKYGILSVLLDWNRTYLPDSFEIHRNNLIYNNYQFNRNPFIDFPEWADYIWGNEQSGYQSTGYAKPNTDNLNQFGSEGNDPLPEVNATGVALNQLTATVAINKTIYLKPVFTPTNTTNKRVTWSSSDSTVATVNSSGKVTGIREGTATISIVTDDGGFTASCTVTVERSLTGAIETSHTITPAFPTSSGDVHTTATAHVDETSEIAFKEKGIYKYNSCMMFTKGAGYLYNTDNLGFVKSVKVTYTGTASESAKVGVYFGSTEQSTYNTSSNATIPNKETSPRATTWTNSNQSYGYFQVSNDNTYNCQIASIEVEYEPLEKELSSLTVSGYTSSFTQYDEFEFGGTAIAHFDDGSQADVTKKVEFEGYDLDTAGNQTVTVSYSYLGVTKTAQYTISVTALATIDSVSVSPSSVTIDLYQGSTSQLTATVTGQGDFDSSVTWSSFSDQIASVSSTGLVTAHSVGQTTIRATSVANYTFYADCVVTIVDTTPIVSNVTLNYSELELDLNGTTTEILVATVNGTNNPSQAVSWSSSASNIVSVDNSGHIQALAKGNATITATSTYDTTKSASCVVTVKDTSSTGDNYTRDEMTKTSIEFSGTSYVSWSSKSLTSDAVYAGVTGGSNGSVQLSNLTVTTDKVHSGIITTTSGGLIRNITVEWESHTGENRVLHIYAKNSAYSSVEDLYSSDTRGTEVGTITSTSEVSADITGDYAYVGVYITGGAVYMSSITFAWEEPETKSLTSISISEPRTNYYVNDDLEKPTVTAYFDNDSNAVVTDSATFTGYDLSVAGNYTVTVSYTYGSVTKTQTYQINVYASPTVGSTPYMNNVEYKMYLNSSGTKYYYTGEVASTYYGATSTTYSDGVYVKFEAKGNGQLMYFMDESVKTYLTVTVNGTYVNFTKVTSAEEIENLGVWKYDIVSELMFMEIDGQYYSFGNSNASFSTFGAAKITSLKKTMGFEETADSFSAMFLNEMTCNASGTSVPSFNDGFSWSEFETRYNTLEASEKLRISSAEKSESGNNIERMLARYEYVIAKYGTSSYKNFLNKSITPLANSVFFFTTRNNNSLSFVIIASVMAISLAGVIIIRKRKHN